MAQKDMKMQSGELLELHGYAEEVHEHDHLTGRALLAFVHHLAHAHGLDLAEEQEKAAKQAEDEQKNEQKAAEQENEQIEKERAAVRKKMDPAKDTIPVPVDSLPSQQDKGDK